MVLFVISAILFIVVVVGFAAMMANIDGSAWPIPVAAVV